MLGEGDCIDGRYRIYGEKGKGGGGIVYLAEHKLYRVNAVYEKVEQKNKKLIQKIQNNQTGKGYKISLRSSHLLKEWNGKICIRLECGESFIVEDWLIDFLAQR